MHITRHAIRRDEYLYTLDIGFDPKQFENGTLGILVEAKCTNTETDEVHKLSATIEVIADEENQPILSIKIPDVLEKEFNLREVTNAEQIIDCIPGVIYGAGDPTVGCLIRSGLSTSIGQIMDCRNKTQDFDWARPRVIAMGKCFWYSIPGWSGKMARKTARCVLRFGF